jgi:hypothetical protein
MARRAHQQIAPWKIGLTLGVVVAAIAAGFLIIGGGGGSPYRTLSPLNVNSYLENANSLRGNVYRLEGVVQNSLAWSPAKGRLISVELTEDDGRVQHLLPIFLPSLLNHVNLQKGQRFLFKVEIGQDGIISAQEITKS